MPKPTEGPWSAPPSGAYGQWPVLGPNFEAIAFTTAQLGDRWKAAANACRMAAAPEMLEDLEWAHVQLCPHPQWCEGNHPVLKPRHDKIRATIAKARGDADA